MFRAIPDSLLAAFNILRINPVEFEHIPTRRLKQEFLECKLAHLEFDIIRDQPNDKELLLEADAAYAEILGSNDFRKRESFSANSLGLQRLMMETTSLSDAKNIKKVADKSSGVEPGFIAEMDDDIYSNIFKLFPEAEIRRETIRHLHGDVIEFRKLVDKVLPRYMFKLTYPEISADGKVSPAIEDISRSYTMQRMRQSLPSLFFNIGANLYKMGKTRGWDELNCEAVAEVLANDIARVYGMKVQEQMLYPTQYANGNMQLLLVGKWVEGARELGENGKRLAGAANRQYLARPLMRESQELTHFSDNSVKLANLLCMMLVIGDRDGIGKKAQNKLVVNNELVGIDFGKAFQSAKLIEEVGCDFRIPEKLADDFPNYTIFNDATRSEYVRGLLMLAAVTMEFRNRPSKEVLRSYGEDLVKQYEQAFLEGDSMVCNDYASMFGLLREQFHVGNNEISAANAHCCNKIIELVNKINSASEKARAALLKKFNVYLSVPAKTADLFENIEKVIAGKDQTSLRSSDGTVLLRHVRMLRNPVKEWRFDFSTETYAKFCAQFENDKQANEARNEMIAWVELLNKEGHVKKNTKASEVVENIQYKLEVKDSGLYIIIFHDEMQCFYDLFAEYQIKNVFHPADAALGREMDYVDKINAALKSLLVKGIIAELKKNNNHYYIEVIDADKISQLLLNQIEATGINVSLLRTGKQKYFKPELLPTVLNLLDKIIAQVEHEEAKMNYVEHLQYECSKYVPSWQLPHPCKVRFTYQAGTTKTQGHYKIHVESTDETLQMLLRNCSYLQAQHREVNYAELTLEMIGISARYYSVSRVSQMEGTIKAHLDLLHTYMDNLVRELYKRHDILFDLHKSSSNEYTFRERFILAIHQIRRNKDGWDDTPSLLKMRDLISQRIVNINLYVNVESEASVTNETGQLKHISDLIAKIISTRDEVMAINSAMDPVLCALGKRY